MFDKIESIYSEVEVEGISNEFLNTNRSWKTLSVRYHVITHIISSSAPCV